MTDAGDNIGPIALAIIERIERLHEERKALATDISEVFKEAKGARLNVKALRALIAHRAEDPDTRFERESDFERYRLAVEAAEASRARTRGQGQ